MTPYYDQDGIQIFHGDCRNVLPTIAPETVGLVLTDPPYGIGYQKMRGSSTRNSKLLPGLNGRRFVPIHGDDQPFDPTPLLTFPRVILWGANNFADKLPPSKGWIVWDKRPGLPPICNGDCELAWTNITGAVRRFEHKWDGINRASERAQKHLHPTQKPVALFIWILSRWSKPSDLILDPYMGSGPVAAACQQLGRRYVGVDLEEAYCEIAVKRLQQSVMQFEGVA